MDHHANLAADTYLNSAEHAEAHRRLHLHHADPASPSRDERRTLRNDLFYCHNVESCGWQPTAEQSAQRARIDAQWLASLDAVERSEILGWRDSFTAAHGERTYH